MCLFGWIKCAYFVFAPFFLCGDFEFDFEHFIFPFTNPLFPTVNEKSIKCAKLQKHTFKAHRSFAEWKDKKWDRIY